MSIAIVSRVEPAPPPDEPTGRPEGVVLDKYTLLRLETQLKKELIALNDDEQAAVVKVYSKHAHEDSRLERSLLSRFLQSAGAPACSSISIIKTRFLNGAVFARYISQGGVPS